MASYKRIKKDDWELLVDLDHEFFYYLDRFYKLLNLPIALLPSGKKDNYKNILSVKQCDIHYENKNGLSNSTHFYVVNYSNYLNTELNRIINKHLNRIYDDIMKIKSKYGYKSSRRHRMPKIIRLNIEDSGLDSATFSSNYTEKVRTFSHEQLEKYIERDFKGFGRLFSFLLNSGNYQKLGLIYPTYDHRLTINKHSQTSLNNGIVLFKDPDKDLKLTLKNQSISYKNRRSDCLFDKRTSLTLTNHDGVELKIYASSEFEDVDKLIQFCEKMYQINYLV
ncbi:hypothetical protein ACP45F_17455 [Vibrio metoecus]|uniref:Uncharacterized protein n=1 Tax=Vibrio metoecus TaxID=1481663 RepID=A0A0Q0TCA9_VIBMT|nr:hypothetical protein [Vibrio metoecus]KQA24470.1 hypothetical protein AAY55_02745 [Vibrio metoecus]